MFGVIAAGRLVQTDFQAVSENQFVISIPEAEKVNHVVVFLTAQAPFPDTMGGGVYFSAANIGGSSWQLLGHITNNKPSAIFKISNLTSNSTDIAVTPFCQFGSSIQPHMGQAIVQIGISVEPLEHLSQQTPAANTTPSKVESFLEYSQKMLENFYNFASSFAVSQAQMTPNPSETFVPTSVLQKWYMNFERKLQQNPYFWKS